MTNDIEKGIIRYDGPKTYRVSVDDVIWVFQDIARHANEYKSIFDAPLLALFRKLHEEYGAAFHMNIYYTTPEHGGFDLSEMPDKYRDEWIANRGWLRLSFHAHANDPQFPYTGAPYEKAYTECKQVMDEIRRFAGEPSKVTTIHYADATPDGVRAFYDCGVRALLGDFAYHPKDGREWLCYYLDHEHFEAVRKNVFWKDEETGMIFFPCDVVLNTMTPDEIPPEMDRFAEKWGRDRKFIDILIHEQYFYPDFKRYESDYEDRIRAGIEWCVSHGYRPGLVSDVLGLD